MSHGIPVDAKTGLEWQLGPKALESREDIWIHNEIIKKGKLKKRKLDLEE